jgi:HD-like signal output (HDOD) protein
MNMPQSRNDWKNQLSAEPLPVLQRSLTQVRDLLNSSSVNHSRLSEVISRDPGFSLHILHKLNQLPTPPKEPITKISVAIPLLGMGLIENAARSLPSLEDKLKGPPRRGLIDCYSRGVHAACYAAAIGERRGDRESGSLYTAALLHDIGEMALWSQAPDEMLQIRRRVEQGEDRDDAALELLGSTFEELNLHLSEKWNLPDLVKVSQGLSNSFQPRPLSIMLASALARESSRGWQRESTLENIELLAEFLDIPTDQAVAWSHSLAADTGRQLCQMPIPLPVFYMICGDPVPKKREAKAQEPKPAEKPTRSKLPEPQPPQSVETPLKETPVASTAVSNKNNLEQKEKKQPQTTLNKTETRPTEKTADKPQKRPANPLQETITHALDEMRQELGLQRAMFAMLNKEKTSLAARLVSEVESDHPLKAFSLELNPTNILSLLMKKPQVIALTPDNYKKYEQVIPETLAAKINQKGCLAMSVFLHNKPIGMFYADNGIEGKLTANQVNNFKAICQRTISTLS